MSQASSALLFFLVNHERKYPNRKLAAAIEAASTHEDYLSILKTFNFKKVKGKALNALMHWGNNQWEFELLDYIPSPYEVLKFQAQGIRPVTLIEQENFKPILMREDCLEFFLHDLEHGHMFFHNEELKKMQINFFKKVEDSLERGEWKPYLKCREFKEKFFYLISDMNSHIEHYRHYLNSMLPPKDINKFEYLFN
ncbi:hypothetical protein ABMA70_12260 [Halobacteriovorax sp. XZX-3]|uniref:hypothetical protein n=1 Tax=unclassified Halobacteriovorax TaxID=2639665 RepID=UPI00372050D4